MSTEIEMNVESFLADFESTGAQISQAILDEGKYRANFVDFQIRYGVAIIKKGDRKGEKMAWNMWNARFELDSATAQAKLKRDNAVTVFSDEKTEGFNNRSISLCPAGIDSQNNIGFWIFVGKLLNKAGLATFQQDDTGEKVYKINADTLKSIYAGTTELRNELLAAPEENDSHMLIPAKLAEKQLKNLSDMLASDSTVRKLYVHIQQRNNSQDSTKREHFVKSVILPEEFEANPSNVALD